MLIGVAAHDAWARRNEDEGVVEVSMGGHRTYVNAVCLADFGNTGIAFVALPQIPPRNLNWSSEGKWVHLAKVGFEKYFLRKMRRGESEPFYERFVLDKLNIAKIKEVRTGT